MEKETIIAKTPIFDVVKVHNETYPIEPVRVKSNDWVSVIVERGGKFLMVEQLRYGINETVDEFVSGIVDDGEFPKDAALRELMEESGIIVLDPKKLVYLGESHANPAFMSNKMHYFLLDIDKAECEVGEQHLDENEKLTVIWVDKSRVFSEVEKCEESCCSTFLTSALYFYLVNAKR